MWIGGKHSMGHIVPAVLELADGATIDELSICTLTFSKQNAEEWADLIDRKRIKKCTVVTSVYFEKTSTGIYDYAASILRPRNVDLFTLRCHAKLACMQLSDGRTITAEGSANTRSAKTIEQVTLFGSPDVYQFHLSQISKGRALQGNEYGNAK